MKFLYKDSSLVQADEIKKTSNALSARLEALRKCSECTEYNHPEDFLHLPFDNTDISLVNKIVEEKGQGLKWIYVVGIGGANLGAQAVTQALRYSVPQSSAKVIFFDTIDPYFLSHFKHGVQRLDKKEDFIVLIMSKSGKTLETITNAKQVTSLLESKFGNIDERVIVLSKEGSPLWDGTGKDVQKIALRDSISDRYSVFSIIGLLPLALGGMDIDAFISGAKKSLEIGLSEKASDNPITISASIANHMYGNGIYIRDFFFFSPELEHLGKWTRQLIAESLGKDGKGITPTVSIGTTDLHSMAQLYLDGPKNRYTTFTHLKKIPEIRIEASESLPGLESSLERKDMQDVTNSIYEGFTESCKDAKLPFSQIILPDLSEYSLGMYMQFLMIETVLIADLFKVDAFNQPAVEEYKIKARESLK